MSFLVVLNSDYAAVDLHRLAQRMNCRIEPQNVQVLGRARHVAFIEPEWGSALAGENTLRHSHDGRFSLIGRVRLDARDELWSTTFGPQATLEKQDDALILLWAYARWGDQCLERLRGDFCFALWDEDEQRLLCGRDQLGVRPLFYSSNGRIWTVSDSLESIVADPAVNGEIDDFWVADFLTNGYRRESDRTAYKQVKRLPAAHLLSVSAHCCVVRRYWTLEIQDPIYYGYDRSYIEHFHEVMALAIRDRLPHDRVGISMSGGLDSPTLAAQALRALGDGSKIIAHTRYFEHLIPDAEKHFSSLVASRLGIRLTLRAIDDACYDAHWHGRALRTPEPDLAIVRAGPERIIAAEMAEQAQVWFFGEGPDNALLFEWQPYLAWLLKRKDWSHLGGAVVEYLLSKRATEWRSTVSKWTRHHVADQKKPPFGIPEWLNQGFVDEHRLTARARQFEESSDERHPWHPRAVASFADPIWQHFLERFDPAVSGTPLIWRHPYLDLRVLSFLLSVPPIPWARRKRLIREAMRGCLPKEVLVRDKSPVSANPLVNSLKKYGLPRRTWDGSILRYIECAKLPKLPPDEPVLTRSLLRVYALDSWLKSKERRLIA